MMYRKASFLFLLAISLLGGCRKAASLENASSGSGNATTGTFTAQISGKSWTALDSARGVSIMNGRINLSGVSSDDQTIVISLDDTVTGTYTLNQQSGSIASWTDSFMLLQDFNTSEGTSSQAGGQVIVSAIDRTNQTITGTFTLNLYSDSAHSTIPITHGIFDSLPYITVLPPAPATDTFSVQINGTTWTAPSIAANIVEGELLVQGSTLDGRQSIGIELARPAAMSPTVIGLWLPFGLSSGGINLGQYNNNGSAYISIVTAPDASIGVDTLYYEPGYLQILENDLTNKRLRVQFGIQLSNPSQSQLVELTQGYFSITY